MGVVDVKKIETVDGRVRAGNVREWLTMKRTSVGLEGSVLHSEKRRDAHDGEASNPFWGLSRTQAQGGLRISSFAIA